MAFASEVIGTLSGFGSSTFFVPVAIHLQGFEMALALTAMLHTFGNASKISLFRRDLSLTLFLKLAVPSLLMAGVGALLTTQVPTDWLKKALGVVLILTAVFFLLRRSRQRALPLWVSVGLCALSGLTTGLVGTGGAIRAVALSFLGLEAGAFVALSAAIDFGGDLLRLVIYLVNGYMDWSHWAFIPVLGAMAYLGSKVGQIILRRLKQRHFEKIVGGFVFAGGVSMLVS